LQSGGNVISVTEQELADAKAMIGREGIGCEPASAATVAGIKKLTAAGKIGKNESVVAVLTGNVLKDPDYVAHYHRGTLSLETGAQVDGAKSQPVSGAFRNAPRRVAATKDAIIESVERAH
jgi:threonine synthase